MKKINDEILEGYYKNILSSDEMKQVESQIIDSDDMSILYSMIALESENEEYSAELLGEDNDRTALLLKESEKYSSLLCQKMLNAYSVDMNNKNIHIMEKAKFTSEELLVITNRFNEIHSVANESESLKDNMISYYMSTNSEITKEDAEKVVVGLMTGVEDLTTKYKAAIMEGWNPKEQVNSMVQEMDIQQRYDFLVNAITIVNALNVHTMGEMQDIQSSIEQSIEKMKSGDVEVTGEVCDELQNTLSELLMSSPLMLTNAEKIKEMMDAADGQTFNVVDFASSQYDDYRYKNEMALATWIEHEKGSLTSLPDDIVPESLGVSIAAGVEEAQILSEVASGSKSIEWAVECLKILGAVALVCFLGYVALLGLALTIAAFFEAAIVIMGTSTVAIIAASVIALLISWGYVEVIINVGTKVLEWSAEAYDWLVVKMKNNVYPTIKRGFNKLTSWVRSLFNKSDSNPTVEVETLV